jgi:hypothetical protein
MGNRSQPDFIFWVPGGRPLLIEFKRPGSLPTPLQETTIGQFRDDGYNIQIHDTKESAIAELESLLCD